MKHSYIEKIKSLRKERNISQKDMAEKLGFGQSNYNKIESGITELSVSKLLEVADVLQVSASFILGDNEVEALKHEIAKRDKLTAFLTVLLSEFANNVNTEDNPRRLQELMKTLREKYPNDNDFD